MFKNVIGWVMAHSRSADRRISEMRQEYEMSWADDSPLIKLCRILMRRQGARWATAIKHLRTQRASNGPSGQSTMLHAAIFDD